MYKQSFISTLKSSKNSMDKMIARGGFVVAPDLRYCEDQKFLRQVTEYNLSEVRRHIRVLRSAIEIHLPNIDEVVQSITKTEVKNDNIKKDMKKLIGDGHEVVLDDFQKPLLSFYDIRLPFEEMFITFLNPDDNRKTGVLVYPYDKHRDDLKLDEIYPINPGAYVIEYMVEEQGQVVSIIKKGIFQFDSVGVLCYISLVDQAVNYIIGNDFEDENQHLMSYAGVIVIALVRLLECKNITLKKHEPPIAGKEREYMRQNGFVCADDFYTLCVTMGGKEVEYGSPGEFQVGKKRFHVCRGHFATYTEEKKLFGKYVGKYWIPAHMKGDPELGTIEKDYEVKHADLVNLQG